MSQKRSEEQFDYGQFKQLTKISLKLDVRSSQGLQYGNKSSKMPQIYGVLMFYFLVSLGLAVGVYVIPSVFTATLIVTTMIMAFVAVNVLIEFGTIILSPDDFEILSPLPVSSKTIFYSKMANLLIYCAIITLSLILVPTVTLAVKTGGVGVPLMFFIAEMSAGVAISMIIALVYAALLKLISAERLSTMLSYFQMLLGFSVWFGYMFTAKIFGKSILSVGELTAWWVFLLPPSWYASLLGVAGAVESGHWVWSALLGVIATAAAVAIGAKYLSISYADSLARTASVSAPGKTRKNSNSSRGLFSHWLRPEDLCVFRLIWAHFKYDNRFKMTVLSLIPLSVMYFFLAGSEGIVDPFAGAIDDPGGIMVFIPLGLLPVMILASLVYSTSHKASWVFFATPGNLTNVILAGLRFVHFAFVIPYTILFAVVLGFFYGNFLHSFIFIAILYLISAIQLRICHGFIGNIPFSIPPKRGQQGSIFMMLIFVVPFFVGSAIALMYLISGSNPYVVVPIIFSILLVLSWLSAMFCRKRNETRAIRLRYTE